jgi:hypothetical protein
VPPESAKGKLGKTTARGFDMVYQIYEGYKQIIKLDYDTMPRAQYAAAVSKIVARLASDYGLFWVGSILGAFTAGLFTGGNPLGAIGGFIAGGTGGIAASYLLGDSVGAITDSIVDSVYGTDKTPAPAPAPAPEPQQNKLTPEYIAKNKEYLEGMTAWIAAGGIPDERDKKDMDEVRAVLKAAGVAVAPAPQAAERVPAVADSVARYQETFDKANAIVDKIKNLDPLDNPIWDDAASAAALAKFQYDLISELTSLYAREIGAEGQKDPAVAKQMESILAAARAAAKAKNAEHDAGHRKTTTGKFKEGDTGTIPGNPPKKVIFKNGKWVPQ